jgi:hypothetical protein
MVWDGFSDKSYIAAMQEMMACKREGELMQEIKKAYPVYVITWIYSEASGGGVVGVYDNKQRADLVLNALKEFGGADQCFSMCERVVL